MRWFSNSGLHVWTYLYLRLLKLKEFTKRRKFCNLNSQSWIWQVHVYCKCNKLQPPLTFNDFFKLITDVIRIIRGKLLPESLSYWRRIQTQRYKNVEVQCNRNLVTNSFTEKIINHVWNILKLNIEGIRYSGTRNIVGILHFSDILRLTKSIGFVLQLLPK